ncbi:DUF3124 domain-containing protein [Balneola vulgaris]|uniref:DUF3124 domain-containing protein n=1 Tax=Balneola vulgaris TaxID=287535 RepID=UPI0003809F22|nr:DUF3124 domain-containing protein [Balneola vulgaris]
MFESRVTAMPSIDFKITPAFIAIFISVFVLQVSCTNIDTKERPPLLPSWTDRTTPLPEEIISNPRLSSYLPVYSEIYSNNEHRTHALTATISIRNINKSDTIWVDEANYFNTQGELIRAYIQQPVYLAPLETVEIVIAEDDLSGGSGSNFLFSWVDQTPTIQPPFIQAVMISTSGQQGISFVTEGIPVQ